ncbi:hypothetical protein XENTR_v10009010 [Xenopus tropicalis]|nr:hypothetical protein XENTR_v10009010 [Xenopus tropicalis]
MSRSSYFSADHPPAPTPPSLPGPESQRLGLSVISCSGFLRVQRMEPPLLPEFTFTPWPTIFWQLLMASGGIGCLQ